MFSSAHLIYLISSSRQHNSAFYSELQLQENEDFNVAHRPAETAAEKDETLRKRTLRRGKLQNKRCRFLGRVKVAESEEQQKVIKGGD